MRARAWILGTVTGCIAVVGAALLVVGGRVDHGSDSSTAVTVVSDPAALEPAPPAHPVGTAAADAGAGLVGRFRQLVAPALALSDGADAHGRLETCRAVAADLDREVDPKALLQAAAELPDSALSSLAMSERTAVSDLLVACGDQDVDRTLRALHVAQDVDAAFAARLQEIR